MKHELVCIRCGSAPSEQWNFDECKNCIKEGVSANFKTKPKRLGVEKLVEIISPNETGMWKYRKIFGIQEEVEAVSLNEGNTPLMKLDTVGELLGLHHLYVKDEARNPTWSHKDRLSSAAITKAKAINAKGIVLSSTGNQGISAAAYAAKAGLNCIIFTAPDSPSLMRTLMQSFGAKVFLVETGEERARLVKKCVDELDYFPVTDFVDPHKGSNPFGIDGYKSMAVEIILDLGEVPDKILIPTAGGDALVGIYRGFEELYDASLIDKKPVMIAVEAFGPLEKTIRLNSPVPLEVDGGDTIAFSVATTSAAYQALQTLQLSGGTGCVVSSEEMLEKQQLLARHEGIFCEPTSAMPLSAVEKLLADGTISNTDKVVCVLTSSGLKDVKPTAAYVGEPPHISIDEDDLKEALLTHYQLEL